MAFITAAPVLSTSARAAHAACSVRPALRSAFSTRAATVARPAASTVPRMEFEISEGVPFKINLAVIGLAIVGWVVPSSIPSGIPLTEGTGLSQAFFASMNANLAAFPKGPSASDPFWLLCFLWHVGLFACLIFGTIGWNLRTNPSQD